MLGCAVGDALGAPFEGRSRDFMRQYDDLTAEYKKFPGYPTGQYTDDTQMTLKLAESIISSHGIIGADIAESFSSLWRNNAIVGGGEACRESMMSIIVHGASWDESGVPEGRAGNGTAMRTSPIALFDCKNLTALRDDAITQSIITHKDARASAGAVAVTAALYYCINNDDIDPTEFIDFLLEQIRDINDEFTTAVTDLKNIVTLDEEAAFSRIMPFCDLGDDYNHGVTGYVVPTVIAALYSFLRYVRDWRACVTCALRFGGDTDTVTSIAGAISGAFNGRDAIPDNLIEDLKETEYIQGIAMKLYEVVCAK